MGGIPEQHHTRHPESSPRLVTHRSLHGAAFSLMLTYPVVSLEETRATASAHLRALEEQGGLPREVWLERRAMFGVVLGDALADLGRLDEVTGFLDAAERHARQADHLDLLAWIAGTRALALIQRGDPFAAVDICGLALSEAKGASRARLYAILAQAYALRAGGVEAAAALWCARTGAEKFTHSDDVFGIPFQAVSRAQVACAAASTHAILRDNRMAADLAARWTPLADRMGHTALRICLRVARAAALAGSDPGNAYALMSTAVDIASEFGEIRAEAHRVGCLYFERATDAAGELSKRYRSLRTPWQC